MNRFAGKVALVTGGSAGIGRAVARAFAVQGATVVVTGRNAENLAQTVKLIDGDGGTASQVVCDVTSSVDIERMVATTVERHGGLDIAVNNAGVFTAGPLHETDEADWSWVFTVNVTGVMLSMKYEIGHMREHGGGVIVNVSSNLGPHLRVPGLSAYSATKAAVSALTRTAALEYIGDGIRINAVSPGTSDTTMSLHPGESEAERDERARTEIPIGRIGSLDEVAATILFLASPDSGFAVGHDLVIDGGNAA
jgi:NAD(P)-dependent dehydrogenase (short-subunit alcohol dehydrogenase family)